MSDYCPYLTRRARKMWLCKLHNDVCTHTHYASCTRYDKAQKLHQYMGGKPHSSRGKANE